jgi:hypothetical protein
MPRVLIGKQRRQAGLHFLGRLVGESHRQDPLRTDLPGGNQPGDARGQHPRLATAGTGQDQGMLRRQGDRGKLRRIEMGEQIGHESEFPGE